MFTGTAGKPAAGSLPAAPASSAARTAETSLKGKTRPASCNLQAAADTPRSDTEPLTSLHHRSLLSAQRDHFRLTVTARRQFIRPRSHFPRVNPLEHP